MSKIIKKVSAPKGTEQPIRRQISDIIPDEGGVVLNKKVMDAKERGQLIIDSAEKEADKMREEAQSLLERVSGEMEQAKKDGFEQGREEGLRSVTEYAVALNNIKEKFYAKAEPDMIKMVMTIAEKVIGKMVNEHQDAIKSIVYQAIESGLGERVTVRLNPEDYTRIATEDVSFKGLFDKSKRVVFKEDEAITKGGCVVETEVGTIDARLETQLKAIRKALQL